MQNKPKDVRLFNMIQGVDVGDSKHQENHAMKQKHRRALLVCHILALLMILAGLMCVGSSFVSACLHPEQITSFPQYVYFFQIVPFALGAAAIETIALVLRRWCKM